MWSTWTVSDRGPAPADAAAAAAAAAPTAAAAGAAPDAASSHPFQPPRLPPKRAVKSPNILLTASGTAKLADVGFSKSKPNTFLSTVSLVGTCELGGRGPPACVSCWQAVLICFPTRRLVRRLLSR